MMVTLIALMAAMKMTALILVCDLSLGWMGGSWLLHFTLRRVGCIGSTKRRVAVEFILDAWMD